MSNGPTPPATATATVLPTAPPSAPAYPPSSPSSPPTAPTPNRRALLIKGGAGLVIVAAGGTLWRALDQGVFATGTGAAYAAWGDWAGTPEDGAMNLVRAAVLAANAHDSQP